MRRNFLRVSLLATYLLCVLPVLTSCTNKAAKAQEAYDSALEFVNAGNYKNAIASFKKSLKYDNTNPDAWYNYGSLLLDNNSYTEATNAFEKAAEFSENTKLYDNPEDLKLDALVSVGEAYLWQGNVENATAKFQSVFDTVPENKNVVLNIVATYVRCRHFDLATNFLKANETSQGVKNFLDENQLFVEMMR